ncbi:MAG: amino acid adenylation domain-containing protein [Myxococcales bacterium]|nr:amino acid adenylation domain-containing protein [Myxococcales bacterium]
MTTIHELLTRLASLEISIWDDDGYLGYSAPEGAMTDEIIAALRQHKEALLTFLRQGRDAEQHQQLRPRPHDGVVPISPAQRGLWSVSQIEGGSVAYNVPFVSELSGPLDARALGRALTEIIRRHESLHTTFRLAADGPVQVIHPPAPLELVAVELDALDSGARDEALARRLDDELHRAFDLERGPLLRAALLRLAPARHVLAIVVHHIVCDGWSLSILVRELNALYAAYTRGRASPLPPPPLQYADYSRWHAQRLTEHTAARHLEHWREALAELPLLRLPADRPTAPEESFRGELLVRRVDRGLTRALRAASEAVGVNLHATLFAAFQALLARLSGQLDFAVASGTVARRHPDLEGVIGHFFNIAMIRGDLSDDPRFADFARRTRDALLAAGEHEDLPFERVVEGLRPARRAGRNPFTSAALSLERFSRGGLELPGITSTRGEHRFRVAKLDVALWISELEDTLEIAAEYNSDLFDRSTIERLCARFERLLRGVARDQGRRVSDYELLEDDERRRLLTGWNQTDAPPVERRVHQRVAEQAARAPEAVALVDLCAGGRAVTYGELDARAEQIASLLRARDVQPGALIGVCVERSAELVAALLGVHKAGCAFVTLDPTHPPQRLAFILEDTGAPLVLTSESTRARVPARGAELVALESTRAAEAAATTTTPTEPDALAYVIYTSGSTGRPNGVLVEHRGLDNAIEAHVRIMETGPGTRHAHVLSFSFDGALAHLYVMLCAGGTVYLTPRDSAFLGSGLVELIEREAITHTLLPPSMLAALPERPLPSLRTLVVAGERCSAALVQRWAPGRRMLNLYGPTEGSILATHARCVPGDRPPPIGRPIANTRVYVLDRWGQLAPPGAVGELALAGVGVARGYLNRPKRTAEKFVESSFGAGRLYLTGDLARYRVGEREPPELEFVGRVDSQLKIRGHRVEPAEIEHVLKSMDEIGDAVVTSVVGTDGAPARLVAYVTPRRASDRDDDIAELGERARQALRERLPAFLVPSSILSLRRLPLTPSGKLDARALPSPEAPRGAQDGVDAPRNDAERELVRIWREVLKVERVGVHDNFFELGGDSIQGIQVVTRAQEVGLSLRSGQLFEHQTVAELAAASVVERASAEQTRVRGPAPLTAIQRWFFEQVDRAPSLLHRFDQTVALEAPAELDPILVQLALNYLQAHHDALRLRFTRGPDGAWAQECLEAVDDVEVVIEEVSDAAALDEAERAAAIERVAIGLRSSLDVSRGPLVKAAIVYFASDAPCRLLLTVHHLVVDAVSWQLLLPDLLAVYRQLAAGEPVSLPAKTTSFKRWAERVHEYARAADLSRERAITTAPPPRPLPLDHPDGDNTRESAAERRLTLSVEETRRLLTDALAPYSLGVHELLLAAIARVVARWGDRRAVWIDLEGHGREDLLEDVELSRTVGWFTSLYPARIELPADDDVEGALLGVKEQLRAIPRRGVGYGLLRYLNPDGAALRWPAPAISFNYLGTLRRELDPRFAVAREGVGPMILARGPRPHTLELNGLVRDGALELGVTYSRALHDDATIARLADELAAELRRLIQHCASSRGAWSPSDFPLAALTRAELAALGRRVGETGRERLAAIYPLTPLQQGMLYHSLHASPAHGSTPYTTQISLTLHGALDVESLRASWDHVAGRHEALRSCFLQDGLREPVQVVLRRAPLQLEVLDWRDGPVDAAALEHELGELARELAARPLPLDVAPVNRVTLVRTGALEHTLLWDSHHILMDGWSMSVLLRELLQTYRALRAHRAPPRLPDAPYERYLRWWRAQDHARAAAHWGRAMQGVESPTPLAIERAVPGPEQGLRLHDVHLPEALTAALRRAADEARLTLATVLAGAWGLVLSRYSGLEDVMFGTVVSGRDVAVRGIESMVGLFIHMLPVRVRVDERADVWAWLRALQEQQAAARAHQITPLVEIQRRTGVPVGTPLFRSVLVYQDYPFDADAFSDPELSVRFRDASDPTHYPIVVTAIPGPRLHFSIEYDAALFERANVERMVGHIEQVLRGMLETPAPRVGELPLLTAPERARALEEWSQTAPARPRDRSVHALFEAQARRTPDAPAVLYGGRSLPYGALDRRANQLARYLRRRGVGDERRVAVCLDRTDAMIVTLLAILKAGGAYVPIDPGYPDARKALMLEDADATLVVTQRGLASSFVRDRAMIVALDGDAERIAAEPDAALEPVSPERLAYIIYTSGSTGRPKGVAIEHRNTVAMLAAARAQYEPEDLELVSACASICFDYSILEIFLPLTVGGAVLLAEDALALPRAPASERVTLLSLVPSAMSELARAGQVPPRARAINLAGERLTGELARRVFELPGVERVYNIYGPTETTTFSTYSRPRRDDPREPTLGRPIAGTRVYLLDRRGRPVPEGVPGEITIGGAGVSRGYWRRPELTRERFIEDPFGPGRLYRTGDLGRHRPDGELEYLGRLDNQVKLRGFRVELGEIEAALERLADVEQAVVVVVGEAPAQRLVAHWRATPGRTTTSDALREALAASLPPYMVPELYVQRDAFPLNANGKVDRRALPAPGDGDAARDDFVAPETPLERALATIWEEVLEVERVGANDNFFRLGGHSLLALTMVLRVESELGRSISIGALFELPSLRALARELDAPEPRALLSESPLMIPIQPRGERRPIFCVGGFGVHASYLHPLGPALGDDQPLYGLQPLDLSAELPEITTMDELASLLADDIQRVQPEGPYTLSGHSAGARLAMAIGFALEARGHDTALVVLDMHAPVSGGSDKDVWARDDDLLGYLRQMKVVLGETLAVDIDATAAMPEDEAWAHVAAALERERLLPPGGGVAMLRRMVALRERVFRLLTEYVPTSLYTGRVTLLSVSHRRRAGMPRVSVEQWQQFCAQTVEATIVPGDHLSMIREPHVGVVAAHLRRVSDEQELDMSKTSGSRPRTAPEPASPAAFHVEWDDPADAREMWLFDAAHCTAPMTPLDFDLRMAPMTEGTNWASARYGLPLASQPRLINSFVFQKAITQEFPPDEAARVWAAADEALRAGGQQLDARWRERWRPEIDEQLAYLEGFDLEGASLESLVEHLGELRRRVVRLWQIHFDIMYPVTLALSDFNDAYLDLREDAKPLDVYELLAGFPTKTTEANLRLWELGRELARAPGLRARVLETSLAALPDALAESPEGQAAWARIQEYLQEYGQRNDDMYLDRPSWIEDPTPVLRSLREAMRQPERDLGAELGRQAERREARLGALREQLAHHPRPVVEEFEALLSAAQASTRLSEEHNFWIDCKITYHARRASLELGRRLTERGALEDPREVFDLSLAELEARAYEAPADELRARVAARQAERARFAGAKPPSFLGVPRQFMPVESCLMRAMFRANGDLMSPQPRPDSLNGSPGSSGRARGPARVVRTLSEAGKLQPGDVLVAPATLPSWTPYFAIVSAIVTNTGGMLCHAAVVAREYGIPSVVGTRTATEVLRDGQLVEVDGDAGLVRIVNVDEARA